MRFPEPWLSFCLVRRNAQYPIGNDNHNRVAPYGLSGSKELRFTRHKPAEADVTGTWRATASTAKEIQERGHYPIADYGLIFRPDHTFSMRNMPDWWRDGFGQSHRQLDSAEGSWAIEPMSDVWQIWIVRLHFSSHETWLNLYRQTSPYLIYVRIGDPDNDYGMFFERVPNA